MSNDFLFFVIDSAVNRYCGDVRILESAIGALFIAYFFGYKFLQLSHSKKTIRQYEKILGISFKHSFNAVTVESSRLPSLEFALKQSNFWKCVSGDVKVPHRRLIKSKYLEA